MMCLRGSAPFGLCVALLICVWYTPTSAREVKAMNLLHNDIDGETDHQIDFSDTNPKVYVENDYATTRKPSRKSRKGRGKKRRTRRLKTTTTTTEATTTTTVTESTESEANLTTEESTEGFFSNGTSASTAAQGNATEAETNVATVETPKESPSKLSNVNATGPPAPPDESCPDTAPAQNATNSSALSAPVHENVVNATTTPTTGEERTKPQSTKATNGTAEFCEDNTTRPGNETSSTAAPTPTVKNNVPKTISYEVFVKKVKVQVVYESLCPFSRKFIVSQLLPTYEKLRNHMHLILLPFGNTRVSKTRTVNPNFICPRGSRECRSNMIETCVIRHVRETLTAVRIIACMSRSTAPHRVARRCVEKKGLRWHLVERCVTMSGKLYMLEMAKMTWQIKKTVGHVPLVVIEGEKAYAMEAQRDLIGVICRRIPMIGICAARRRK